MYLDLEDHRPDTPRVPSAVSLREGVLLSIIVHMAMVIVLLVAPREWFQADPEAVPLTPVDQAPLRFVDVSPLVDKTGKPILPLDQSDMDRRAATRERPPTPTNPEPFSRGNTPEKVIGGPPAPPTPAEAPGSNAPPAPPSPPAPSTADAAPLPGLTGRAASAAAAPATPPRQASSGLGQSLRNLQQYLRNETFDNVQGGAGDTSADIQFDSMGIDFGPWLRRFKNQVQRNWIVPDAAMSYKGRVVIQFYVLRNGTILELNVVQPAGFTALTSSALNALKLSNPTASLPPDYPAERVFFTVTFHYNEF